MQRSDADTAKAPRLAVAAAVIAGLCGAQLRERIGCLVALLPQQVALCGRGVPETLGAPRRLLLIRCLVPRGDGGRGGRVGRSKALAQSGLT